MVEEKWGEHLHGHKHTHGGSSGHVVLSAMGEARDRVAQAVAANTTAVSYSAVHVDAGDLAK